MRILIAEDDFTSRTVLAGLLKKEGHEVITTVNGAEALHALQQPDAPGLAILDWMMPEMDGPDVVRHIRAIQSDLPPYIIMLTSKGAKADIISGLEAGANDYLTKPFDPGELHARVEVGRRMIEMQNALVESREIMAHQATHDSLTGLLNRRAIFERLHEEITRASRHGDMLAVGMCDIDHFKKVNDTYGHKAGDDVICGLAKIMTECLRDFDIIGRIGGEEFLLIVPLKSGVNCISVFERLRSKIAESKILTKTDELSITVSIGVACVTIKKTVDELLEAADTALYRAKNDGRNRVNYDKRCIHTESYPCES